jgi:hypothetical protein
MAKLLLLDVTITPDGSVKDLEKLFPGSRDAVMELLDDISADLQQEALGAFQTKVPFFTGELRNAQILDVYKGSLTKAGFKIEVSDSKHTSTQGRRKPSGAELAELLDNGISEKNGAPLHRRKNAVPAFGKLTSLVAPSKGAPTKGWIDSAIASFEKALDELGE